MESMNPKDLRRLLLALSFTADSEIPLVQGLPYIKEMVESGNSKKNLARFEARIQAGQKPFEAFVAEDFLPLHALKILDLGFNLGVKNPYDTILHLENSMRQTDMPFKKNFICFILLMDFALKNGLSKRDAILYAGGGVEFSGYKESSEKIVEDIEQGLTFSKALSKHTLLFPSAYVNLVALAEEAAISLTQAVDGLIKYDL